MIFFKLDYVIDKTLKQNKSAKQSFLKTIVNINFSKEEAARVWEKIADHKWYVSEKLGRDVGFKVAAIDYLENVYESKSGSLNRKIQKSNQRIYETLSLV
jgi:hypothetical protein